MYTNTYFNSFLLNPVRQASLIVPLCRLENGNREVMFTVVGRMDSNLVTLVADATFLATMIY